MALGIDLPTSVRQGLDSLFADDIYFAPIRHHSPACAFAVRAMIRQLKPRAVLIEGPEGLTELIPLLLDAQTKPPIAILCQAGAKPRDDAAADASTRSAFFPFCEYSPEWVAMRDGAAMDASVAFIDLPFKDKAWLQDDAGHDARSLMAERYLAHSDYLAALARSAGCRDHAELWDHLFELRTRAELADWRTLLGDVYAYCAMARLDYEEAVLEADGSLPRERRMAAHIAHWRNKVAGPIVVVTGGFHTPRLLQWAAAPPCEDTPAASADKEAWLIRYSFDRLDALNGYASGMPSPAYYQQVWLGLNGASEHYLADVALDQLLAFARQNREQGLGEQMSTANVQAAQLQAIRLAMLRGHPGPGRYDLLDAVRSCFVKTALDDGTTGMLADLRRLLGGSRIGDIPPSAGSPPLLEDVRSQARRHGIRLDDTESRNARLDLYRKPNHVLRSRFFHLVSYLDTGLAQWQGGPDFLAGTRLDLMFEDWRYAWTPMVEARLIDLSADGQTLIEVAYARLRREEALLTASCQPRSAANAVQLVIRACLVGLQDRLPDLLGLLAAQLQEDADIGSVVRCGHGLATLWRAREPLGAQDHPGILDLMQRVWSAALYLLPALADLPADAEADGLQNLLLLREFAQALQSVLAEREATLDTEPLHAHLQRMVGQSDCAPGICGAAAAMLVLDDVWPDANLAQRISARFGAGAEQEGAARFLSGLMRAAPELLLRKPSLQRCCNDMIASWDDEAFIAYLPDLRQAFAQLKPQETAEIAQALAALNGAHGTVLDATHYLATEADLLTGARLQQVLLATLARDGLAAWCGGDHV